MIYSKTSGSALEIGRWLGASPAQNNTPFFLSSYAHGHAIACINNRQQHRRHHPPPPLKLGSREALILLQHCTHLNQLKVIHAKIIRHGLSTHQILVRKLLQISSSLNRIDYAALLFHHLRTPDTFTWNLMIRAYTTHSNPHQALLLYNLMISQGFPPDKFTFPFAIRACRVAGALEKGKEVHGFAIKTGFINDTVLFNSLMCLYLECRDVDYGRRVFDKMRVRNVVSWTTLIAGLIACGDLDAASRAFRKMPDRNVVSWTALIDGYVRNQLPQEAFKLFRGMQLHNVRPNEFTLVSLLKASTQLGSLKLGGWVHDYILKNGFEVGAFLGTALIDMYSKCGSLEDARQVFDKMEIKTLATWNAMITSLGVHGYGMEAIDLFAEMVVARVRPDAVTFVGVLCACVRMNDVEQGYRYFKYMRKYYGIKPILEHYSCMIELYRRADLLDEVRELVNSMRMQLNGDVAEEWIRKISSDYVVDLDKLSEPHDQGLDYLGTPTSLLRDQLQCFKWDAG